MGHGDLWLAPSGSATRASPSLGSVHCQWHLGWEFVCVCWREWYASLAFLWQGPGGEEKEMRSQQRLIPVLGVTALLGR